MSFQDGNVTSPLGPGHDIQHSSSTALQWWAESPRASASLHTPVGTLDADRLGVVQFASKNEYLMSSKHFCWRKQQQNKATSTKGDHCTVLGLGAKSVRSLGFFVVRCSGRTPKMDPMRWIIARKPKRRRCTNGKGLKAAQKNAPETTTMISIDLRFQASLEV